MTGRRGAGRSRENDLVCMDCLLPFTATAFTGFFFIPEKQPGSYNNPVAVYRDSG